MFKKKQSVWLFAGGAMQYMMAQKILERGFELIITDINPQCVCARFAKEIIPTDTFNVAGNLRDALRLKKIYDIRAIITASADCHETVSLVGKKLELHVLDPKISHVCRHKHLTRNLLTKAGIPQPKSHTVGTLKEARTFLKKIGTPAVLKATNNSGSRGFAALKTPQQLTKEVFDKALAAGTTGKVIVEEMLMPLKDEIAEQSVETVWYNGKMYWLNWVDRLFRKDFLQFASLKNTKLYDNTGWGVEIGHINPAMHSYKTKRNIQDLVYRAGKALGMDKQKGGHILKADIMLTGKGPYILELTPRLSGGWDSCGTTPAREADFVGGALSLALGEPLNIDSWHRYFEYQDPQKFASMLAAIPKDATDCIGREFAKGEGYGIEDSLQKALNNLSKRNYVSVE